MTLSAVVVEPGKVEQHAAAAFTGIFWQIASGAARQGLPPKCAVATAPIRERPLRSTFFQLRTARDQEARLTDDDSPG
jgi:hypothetical protein